MAGVLILPSTPWDIARAELTRALDALEGHEDPVVARPTGGPSAEAWAEELRAAVDRFEEVGEFSHEERRALFLVLSLRPALKKYGANARLLAAALIMLQDPPELQREVAGEVVTALGAELAGCRALGTDTGTRR